MVEIDLPRLVRALPRHVKFFELLEKNAEEEPWSATSMLRVFGTAGLRKFELPVRWMQDSGALEISAQEKETAAELGRSQTLVAVAPPETVARWLLDEFCSYLYAKVRAGKMKPRSMRLSLRPAVSLLERADSEWRRAPDQAAVESLLENTPGQRAALSAFLGFLKAKHGIELSASRVRRPRHSSLRNVLGNQLAALAKVQPRPSDFESRWLQASLAYFHKLSHAQAKNHLKQGAVTEIEGGYELVFDGAKYWLPKAPAAPRSV